jgi:adenine-specific DNA methylase
MDRYCKRLIEVDLPIKRISAHARREKSIRHGHIATLHIWWARRPLAACRAVLCASLWPDPADELCPEEFRQKARELMTKWAYENLKLVSEDSYKFFSQIAKDKNKLHNNEALRTALYHFIADFSNWDNSNKEEYLKLSRFLTMCAHTALGGLTDTFPLVVDSFAGGGAIPLEALRIGATAFASDLNPIPVLLNKLQLEYIPKFGVYIAEEVQKWGLWVKEHAKKILNDIYPLDPQGTIPIAYLSARTIISVAPDDGTGIPIEVPLMRSMWLAKKNTNSYALRWVKDENGLVKTETLDILYPFRGHGHPHNLLI